MRQRRSQSCYQFDFTFTEVKGVSKEVIYLATSFTRVKGEVKANTIFDLTFDACQKCTKSNFRPLSFDDPAVTPRNHQEKRKKSIPFTLSLYNGCFEGSYWPNKNCWEVTFSKKEHTRTEIHPLKGNLVNFHMQISSRQS